MLHFALNRTDSALVRRATHAGREYLIAPVVAIRAGVLNGELALAEEIGKFPEAWNGIPVPLGHPQQDGHYVSANTPDIVATCPGRFWNAEFVGDRLRGEIWLDVELSKHLGGDALAALKRIEQGKPVDVSTGYFRELEEMPGVLNGVEYAGVQRNMRPDHLALLLHELGACSWKDGCGVPRVNLAVNSSGKLTANQNTGVMIAFLLRPEDAQVLALGDGLLPDGSQALQAQEMHITLAYFGDMEQMPVGQDAMLQAMAIYAKDRPIVRGVINGVARFATEPGVESQPIVALVDSDFMHEMHRDLLGWFGSMGVRPAAAHGFNPHITLAYVPANAPTPNIKFEPRDLVFEKIALAWGDQVTVFDLAGEAASLQPEEATNSVKPPKGGILSDALAALARALGMFKVHKEDESMDEKKKLIEKLAANTRCPLKQPALEKLELEDLQAMDAALQANCGASQEPKTNEDEQPDQAPAGDAQADALVQRLESVEKKLAAIQSAIQSNANQEKDDLVAELVANGTLDKADLDAMNVEALRKLRQALQPASFGGRGLPRTNQNAGEFVEAPMPKL